jgi:hypothetical protein
MSISSRTSISRRRNERRDFFLVRIKRFVERTEQIEWIARQSFLFINVFFINVFLVLFQLQIDVILIAKRFRIKRHVERFFFEIIFIFFEIFFRLFSTCRLRFVVFDIVVFIIFIIFIISSFSSLSSFSFSSFFELSSSLLSSSLRDDDKKCFRRVERELNVSFDNKNNVNIKKWSFKISSNAYIVIVFVCMIWTWRISSFDLIDWWWNFNLRVFRIWIFTILIQIYVDIWIKKNWALINVTSIIVTVAKIVRRCSNNVFRRSYMTSDICLLWAKKTTSQRWEFIESHELLNLLHFFHRTSSIFLQKLKIISWVCLLHRKHITSLNNYLN